MALKINFSRNPFSLLAVEIRQAILCEISDIETLDAALEADISFQSVFSGFPSLILDRIVHNIVPSPLLPDIHACLASRHFNKKTWSKDRVLKISANYFRRQVPEQIQWKLDDIRFISNLHQAIQLFVEEFSSSTLSTTGSARPSTISPSERHRIMSTFYRFEIYSNLFRPYADYPGGLRSNDLDKDVMNTIFFSQFAPWENEQFACIYDHLVQKISPAFFDMAEHDVGWGEIGVLFDRSQEPEIHIERILSLGLVYLRQVQAATSYEERHRLLEDYPVPDNFILPLVWDIEGDDISISGYTEEQKKALANHSATNDLDPGPYNAWLWAHTNSEDHKFFFSEPHESLRRKGYVMWDYSRLVDEWDLFSKPFESVENNTTSAYSEEDIEYSYDRRSDIWHNGGRGWWDKDDESKIVWLKSDDW